MRYPPSVTTARAILIGSALVSIAAAWGFIAVLAGANIVGSKVMWSATSFVTAACTLIAKNVWETACEFENRFATDLRIAREELKYLRSDREKVAYARKHRKEICDNAEKIRAEYRERMANARWIDYVESRSSEGGGVILAYYRRDMRMLALAEALDVRSTRAEDIVIGAQEKLVEVETIALGEEEIELKREQMRGQRGPDNPWEKVV